MNSEITERVLKFLGVLSGCAKLTANFGIIGKDFGKIKA